MQGHNLAAWQKPKHCILVPHTSSVAKHACRPETQLAHQPSHGQTRWADIPRCKSNTMRTSPTLVCNKDPRQTLGQGTCIDAAGGRRGGAYSTSPRGTSTDPDPQGQTPCCRDQHWLDPDPQQARAGVARVVNDLTYAQVCFKDLKRDWRTLTLTSSAMPGTCQADTVSRGAAP